MSAEKPLPKKKTKPKPPKKKGYKLPTGRRDPVADPWAYAFLITGQKKIGKTSFAIQGCEEFVLQFDKPQLSYSIREEGIESWNKFIKILKALEAAAEECADEGTDFPYQRIVIDGAGEWYTMLQTKVCKDFGVDHPSEVGYARAWHALRDQFIDAVNRLMRLQITAQCGLVFICHCEWKEVKTKDGRKIDKLVPNLSGRCEEILGGKVDGWFVYDYYGSARSLILQGSETIGAGHRIDGHFLTSDGRRIEEIHMGNSAKAALKNFLSAFRNEQTYANCRERSKALRKDKAIQSKDKKPGKKAK